MKTVFAILAFFIVSISLGQQGDIFEKNKRLGKGINLGNVFEAPSEGEWGNPFRNDFFVRISELGFRHVRIPIRWDTPQRTNQSPPYSINPAFFGRIKEVVDMALDQDLLVIINMHHHDLLFQDPLGQRAKFISQWKQISEFFKDYPKDLYFEVLNEPHDQLSPALWNEFFAEALAEIREHHPDRPVLMGTAEFGGVSGIFHLVPPPDENIIVSVHFYSPFHFTHQGAEWVGQESQQWLGTRWQDLNFEREAIVQELAPVLNFSQRENIPIHMGEFGAYSTADMESRVKWTTFVARYFDSLDYSWAYWEWSAGFGIFDPNTNQYRQELVDALLVNPMPDPQEAYAISIYESDFSNSTDGWTLFVHAGAQANLIREQAALSINIRNPGTQSWHVQLTKEGFRLENGKMYRFSFEGRAEEGMVVGFYLGKNSDPYNSYSGFPTAELNSEFREFTSVFTMSSPTDNAARMVFDLGTQVGTAEIRKIKLEEIQVVVNSIGNERIPQLTIYPNPTRDRIRVRDALPGSQIQLVSILGEELVSFAAETSEFEIDLSIFPPGVYLFRQYHDRVWQNHRVIKR